MKVASSNRNPAIPISEIRERLRRRPLKASHRQTMNRLLDLCQQRGSVRVQAHIRELGGTRVVRELAEMGILEFTPGAAGRPSNFHLPGVVVG